MRGFFHVSSVLNRTSIETYGLDWRRMGAARGIAGSSVPEVEGVFLSSDEADADWFVRMNNTGGPVDVWRVANVRSRELAESGTGFFYLPRTISPDDVALVRRDLPVVQSLGYDGSTSAGAYASTLTITWDCDDD